MNSFIRGIHKILLLGTIIAIITINCVSAIGDVFYITGMYNSRLEPERYSIVWSRAEVENGILTTGIFRGHRINVMINYLDGQTTFSSDNEETDNLVHDFINHGNLEQYNLSNDEKIYLTISLCFAVRY